MAQTMMGHGPGGVFVLDLRAHPVNVLLKLSDGGEVLVTVRHAGGEKQVEFPDAPGAVHAAEAAALQLHAQIAVGGKMIFRPLHFIVEKRMAARSVLMVEADFPRSCISIT